jgi:hypothetical protein
MESPVGRKYSFDSVTISPIGSDVSDSDLRVLDVAKRSLFFPICDSPPLKLSKPQRLDLNHLALEADGGLGFKSANMLQLERLAKDMGVLVPPFITLGHSQVLEHIEKTYPEFLDDYKKFVDLLAKDLALTDESKLLLEKIRTHIELSFSGRNIISDPKLAEWISTRSSSHVIVRSTGKEDSDDLSNAGGNLSIPFTEKSLGRVSENIGKVVASYFSEKSIAQRLASRDHSLLFETTPFVPVLIQEEIKERDGAALAEVPRSGVMFIGGSFSQASIGLGHNEGIVSSSVATDTVRFTTAGGVRTSIEPKHHRVRFERSEDGSGTPKMVPTDGKIATSSALTPEQAKKLQNIANYLYIFFEKKLDVEFTILNGEIYLLQVRPLKVPEPLTPPSYIEPKGKVFNGVSITDGGSFVRKIESVNQRISSDTITEAYELYTSLSIEEQSEISAIIIKEVAPRTSHEAVFFIGQGLYVMQVEDDEGIDIPFFMDPQQGIIAMDAEEKPGYVCYPMPLAYSMEETELVAAMHMQSYEKSPSRADFIQKELDNLRERVGDFSRVRITSIADLRAQLEIIKKAGFEESSEAIEGIIKFLYSQIQRKDLNAHSRIELILVLQNIIDIKEKESLITEPMSLERLYVARLIEACLFQDGKNIVAGLSYMRTLTGLRDQRIISTELKRPLTEDALLDAILVKLKLSLVSDEAKDSFGKMISQFSKLAEEDKLAIRDFFSKIDQVESSDILVNVLISNLTKKYQSEEDYDRFFEELKSSISALTPALEISNRLLDFVDEKRKTLDKWQDPQYVFENIGKLGKEIAELGFDGRDSFVDQFSEMSPEAKLLIVQAFKKLVDVYDELIKMNTSSREYESAKQHASDFCELLRPYRHLVKVVKEMNEQRLSDRDQNYLFPTNIQMMSEKEAKKTFQVTKGFNVSEILQDEVEFTLEEPRRAETLEEKFTLFHQTLLRDLSKIEVKNGLNLELLPKEFVSFIEKITEGELADDKILRGIKVEKNFILVDLGIPLRQHGATLSLRFDRKNRRIQMSVGVYGGNENNRFGYIQELAKILSDQIEFKVKTSDLKDTSLQLSFYEIDMNERVGEYGEKLLSAILDATFTLSGFALDSDSRSKRSVLEILPSEFQTDEIIERELLMDSKAIQFVSVEKQTKPLVKSLLQKNGLLLEHIAPRLKEDSELLDIAVLQNSDALKFVPLHKQTEELCFKAVEKKPSALAFVSSALRNSVYRRVEDSKYGRSELPKPKRGGLRIADD